MDNYRDYFDVVFSINTFDVITNEALENVALGCQKVLQRRISLGGPQSGLSYEFWKSRLRKRTVI